METKEKGGISANFKTHRKDTTFPRIKQVLSLLKNNNFITAKGANEHCNFNDTRKVISVLRRNGYNIKDRRRPNGTKEYSLVTDNQLSLTFNTIEL
jgi:hypothetical protein